MTPNTPGSEPRGLRRLAAQVEERARAIAARATMEVRFRRLRAASDKLDVRVVGLRRSGNHAVIGWILAQHPGRALFLNEALPGVSPHRTRQRLWQWQRPRQPGAAGLLLYSYEDQSLLAVDFPRTPHRERYAGPARARRDLLLLRDPFNFIASRLRWEVDDTERVRAAVGLWKTYAREFVGDTNVLPFKVPVSFNAWTSDPAYRARLADRLGIPCTDAGLDRVAPHGGGSSFDGRAFDGRATAMAVHDRWRGFTDDPTFLELTDDAELHELSARAFGALPDTHALLGAAR